MSQAAPNQISVTGLWAEDVPTTVRFYSEVIGLQLCPCQGYHMHPPHFDVGGAYLVILKGKSVLAQNSETFPVIALAVEDLDSAVERLKVYRVDLLKDVQEDESSRWVFFCDPGGNLIELAFWKYARKSTKAKKIMNKSHANSNFKRSIYHEHKCNEKQIVAELCSSAIRPFHPAFGDRLNL